MRELAERAYFLLSLALGKVLRAGKYSRVRIIDHHGQLEVRKQRLPHAPLLVWLGEPLVKILDTGVRVVNQREWEERERLLYHKLYGQSLRVEAATLIMPCLPGKTLATLLADTALTEPDRNRSIELATGALARFHDAGFTHGDAMAENVMVDLGAKVAHWFDFETVHDPSRPLAWQRADDVRALLTTSLVRTAPGKHAETLTVILDAYANEEVSRLVAASISSILRRPLPFHLGQAALSFRSYREIERVLKARVLNHQRTFN